MNLQNKAFLTIELPQLLRSLQGEQDPNFGLMTAHHMVEHLIWTTKLFSRRTGEPTAEPTKSQIGFQKFVAKGCPFKYKPKEGVTKANLSPLKYESFEEAIQVFEETNQKIYKLLETQPDYKSYHSMTGEFEASKLDILLGQHARWHAYQFGLSESYETVNAVS